MRFTFVLLMATMAMTLSSCVRHAYLLDDVNRIDIFIEYDGHILVHTGTSKELVAIFREVLDGRPGQSNCSTTGDIRFLSGDSILLMGNYSIGGADEACRFLIIGKKAGRLTYRAGMYLSEKLFQLKKAYERDN